MNREQLIAHLQLHGYAPYANPHGWVAIWNGTTGRMCKWFAKGSDGPGWDVRTLMSHLALRHYHEIPWHHVDDELLHQMTVMPQPAKFRHKPPVPTKEDPLGQRGYA